MSLCTVVAVSASQILGAAIPTVPAQLEAAFFKIELMLLLAAKKQ